MANSETKSVIRHGRLYGLSNLISRSSGLVLLPVYTHILTPVEFGLYASTILVTDLISVVLGMGLGRALIRMHVEQETQVGKDAVVWSAMAMFAAMSVVIAVLAHPIALLATNVLFGSTEEAWLFTWAIWALIPSTLFNLQLNYIVVLKKSFFYLIISVLKAFLFIALNLWIVVWLGLGVFGIVVSTFCASAIVVGVILAYMVRTTSIVMSRPLSVEMAKFGAPLVPTILLDTVIASLDRYIISPVQGTAALGYYGLAVRLASLINLFVTSPFLQIWGVRQLEALEADGDQRELPNVFFQFTLVLLLISAAIGLFSGLAVQIIADDAYAPAAAVLPWLAAAQVAVALRNFAEIGLHHAKKTSPLMVIAFISLAVAVPLYWGAVHVAGIIGVAAASFLLALLRTCLTMGWADRHSGLIRLFPWVRLGFAAIISTVVVLVGTTFDGRFLPIQEILLKLGVLAVLAVVLGLLAGGTDWIKQRTGKVPQVKDAASPSG
ncbi:O-antigen/teichoic acid export membrane protein [Microvirga lupini]|uniref:O-antigen/teichoic acid export membrane protein n=1 Tax=Microvirga lupini TaxID=420324 RepID=A0A7W4Z063_9HYPH|nr:oligosaccharide flippase family protein [Microvirga lupini]MBB3021698.1 O-antigen/teichoic acid export membrane protein [Microvirga lupini]